MVRLIRVNGSDQRTKNKSKNMEETERRLKLDTYKNYLKENGNNETEYWKQYNDNDDNSKLDWGMAIVNKETEKEVDMVVQDV